MLASILILGWSAIRALSAPAEVRHVLHEKRSAPPAGWMQGSRLDGHRVLPMRIALTQSNMHRLEEYLMDVSHPTSDKYGQHWTPKQVAETFAPSMETAGAATEWLRQSGIDAKRIKQSQSLGWLNLDVTVAEAEALLKTEYWAYEHESGVPQIACQAYHVPEHISKHVDFITPTIHFDAKLKPPVPDDPQEGELERRDTPGAGAVIGRPGSGSLPKKGRTLSFITNVITALDSCNQYITPNCLRALYQIPPPPTNKPSEQRNPYGIVEYTPQLYVQSDLTAFFANYSTGQKQKTPALVSIDGGPAQTADRSFDVNGESDLDLEYAMTLANPIPVTLYQVGDTIQSASFNTFLDALNGSYCASNDPNQDPQYPDPNPGGYKGPTQCGGVAATNVISTSYGYNEADLSPAYEARQCQEYAKLGMMGTSVLFSSGDYGVAGNGGQCLDNGKRFNPAFPSTCPFVTSVGATQIPTNGNTSTPEVACFTTIASGGGFANNFALPSYQSAAVANYFAKSNPPFRANQYNSSRKARGYPDISANGANYVVIVDGQWSLVYGTSASAPVVGAIVTIVNENRAQAGKGPVGFLNPTLYAHPEVLNDITSGSNPGCGTNGFSAVAGWDPVTGLGTPNTPKMINLFRGLP